MKHWNVCAAFLSPKGIRTNSNNPKGVVRAVLGTSSGAIGIWWCACTRSSLVKMVALRVRRRNHECAGLGNGQEQCTDSECGSLRMVSNHLMCSWVVLCLVNTPG